jgi:hypothetical protein
VSAHRDAVFRARDCLAKTCLGGRSREHGCNLDISPLLPACSSNAPLIEGGGYAGGTGHSLFLNFTDDRSMLAEYCSTETGHLTLRAHGLRICRVQRFNVFFPQLKELRSKSCHPIRMALLYLPSVAADNFLLAGTRRDFENSPPFHFRLCGGLLTLSLTLSVSFAFLLCFPSSPLGFSSLFRFALTFGLLLSLCLALAFFVLPALRLVLLFGLPLPQDRVFPPKFPMLVPKHGAEQQCQHIYNHPTKMKLVRPKSAEPVEQGYLEEDESQHDGQPTRTGQRALRCALSGNADVTYGSGEHKHARA